MISRTWNDLRVEDGGLNISVSRALYKDTFEIFIWERYAGGGLDGERGSFHHRFVDNGMIEKVFIGEGREVDRPSLEISAQMAPAFFRLMGMAADQLGVLPDVVAAQIAKLETEVRLLREMLERTDEATVGHINDLRMMSRQVVHVPRSEGGF